jgi:hypothetical protein
MFARVPLAALACMGFGCRPEPDPAVRQAEAAEATARAARLAGRLARTAAADPGEPLARWVLPRELGEISGLALAPDGRLFAHDDELGRVTVIDPRRGLVLKQFMLGQALLRGDFEGITMADGTLFMVTSSGTVYEFSEGANQQPVQYAVHDLRLGAECEFEGVAYDRGSASLLLPCKTVGREQLRDRLVIYRWKPERGATPRLSLFTVPLRDVIGANKWVQLHPSDITVDPATGHYVLVAAQEAALVEITPSGGVVRSGALPGKHNQAEGVAITPDGILIISDEASSRSATITLYRWPVAMAASGSS